MKKLLISCAALALSSGAALAADLPSRKAAFVPAPPPPPLWTGFYAGLNAGYGFGTNSNVQSIAYGGDKSAGFMVPGEVDAVLTSRQILADQYFVTTLPTGAGLAQSGNFAQTQGGFIGGGQVGYNYQWSPNFVVGLEADFQGTTISGSSSGIGAGAGSAAVSAYDGLYTGNFNASSVGSTSVSAGVNWLGTVRGRLGYLVMPTLLAYATGGLTYGGVYANVRSVGVTNVSGTISNNNPEDWVTPAVTNVSGLYNFVGGGTKSQTLVGWNVGGGLEWMFMPNWSVKAEGIYWNMGNMNVPTTSVAAAPGAGFDPLATVGAVRVNYQGVIARAGVNYHFNW